MKTTTRSSRSLPSPLKFSFYLLVVTAFCFLNWTFLKAGDPVQHDNESLESMIVEAMLEELVPETGSGDLVSTPVVNSYPETHEQTLELEAWMFSYEAFSMVEAESDPTLEDWMINASAWSAPEYIASK